MVQGETGCLDIDSIVSTRIINYWSQLVNGPDKKIASQIYKLAKLKNDCAHDPFKSAWMDKVKSILITCEKEDLWNSESFTCNIKQIHKRIREKAFSVKWKSKVETDLLCRSYATFKKDFKQEEYMKHHDQGCAILLAQLRTNNCVGIPTVKLRYARDEPNLDCPLCKQQGVTGNEAHYLLSCPAVQLRRPKYKKGKDPTSTPLLNLTDILSCNRIGHITRLAKFVQYFTLTLKEFYNRPADASNSASTSPLCRSAAAQATAAPAAQLPNPD